MCRDPHVALHAPQDDGFRMASSEPQDDGCASLSGKRLCPSGRQDPIGAWQSHYPFSDKLVLTLKWIERQTHLRTTHARMLCGPEVGSILARYASGCRHILELGAFTGYSTVCLAADCAPDGLVESIEINDELDDLLREGFARAGLSDRIRVHYGDALKILPSMRIEVLSGMRPRWDLVYIDANKRNYLDYYQLIIDCLAPGGVILADNVFWSGKAFDPQAKPDAQTAGIRAFNAFVASDPRVDAKLLDLRDGLYVIRLK